MGLSASSSSMDNLTIFIPAGQPCLRSNVDHLRGIAASYMPADLTHIYQITMDVEKVIYIIENMIL